MSPNYIDGAALIQEKLDVRPELGHLTYPAGLTDFQQTEFVWVLRLMAECKRNDGSGTAAIRYFRVDEVQEMSELMISEPRWECSALFRGFMVEKDEDRICPCCGAVMHVHSETTVYLQHTRTEGRPSALEIKRKRYVCVNEECRNKGKTVMQPIPFRAEGHRMTQMLRNNIESLLGFGFTLKDIGVTHGVHRHVIKAIDSKRLKWLYQEEKDGEWIDKRPERQATILGIDEFKLHNGHEYATIIIDMETGHVLWVMRSRTKQVVYDFIDHVGPGWMKNVKAICSDMNADYAAAFKEKCPHLDIVYDRFHVVKNMGEMVTTPVRVDEQKRLLAEGKKKEAQALKGMKYILTSRRDTLEEMDRKAAERIAASTGSDPVRLPDGTLKGGKVERLNNVIAQNQLLFIADYLKDLLNAAY